MTQSLLSAILLLLEAAIRLVPQLAEDIKLILSKDDPSADDWTALRTKVTSKSYYDYVPESDLPKADPGAEPPIQPS